MRKFLNIYIKTAIFFGIAIILIFCAKAKSNAELPKVKTLGGSYEDVVHQDYDHEKFHVHHLISRQAWNRLGKEMRNTEDSGDNSFITQNSDQNWAPAILMEKTDHKLTRSYYNPESSDNQTAIDHINYEFAKLSKGNVWPLLNEESADIKRKFGNKYDRALGQMFASMKGNFQLHGNDLLIYDQKSNCTAKYRFKSPRVLPITKAIKRPGQPLGNDIRKYFKITPTESQIDSPEDKKSIIAESTKPSISPITQATFFKTTLKSPIKKPIVVQTPPNLIKTKITTDIPRPHAPPQMDISEKEQKLIKEQIYKSCIDCRLIMNIKERAIKRRMDDFGKLLSQYNVKTLMMALEKDNTFTSLELPHNCCIEIIGATSISKMLTKNTTLEKLIVFGGIRGFASVQLIANSLKTNTTLTELKLLGFKYGWLPSQMNPDSLNPIGSIGAQSIADMLKINDKLTNLDLSGNVIDPEGAYLIAESLKINTTLKELHLAYCNIGTKGAKKITEALEVNKTLLTLDLSKNDIETEGAIYIAEALKTNSTLNSLNLLGNKITDPKGMLSIGEMLKINKSLLALNLGKNGINTAGIYFLCEALISNNTLINLNLRENIIRNEGIKYIVKTLKINTTLSKLTLSTYLYNDYLPFGWPIACFTPSARYLLHDVKDKIQLL